MFFKKEKKPDWSDCSEPTNLSWITQAESDRMKERLRWWEWQRDIIRWMTLKAKQIKLLIWLMFQVSKNIDLKLLI